MSPQRPLPVVLATIALLVFAGSAQALVAADSPAPAPPRTLAAPVVEGEEAEVGEGEPEDEGEGCEALADEEACEETEDESESSVEAPPECLLGSAEAIVVVTPNRDRVRLQIRYRATAPTAVTISYGLHGSRGALYLGDERTRFGRRGVVRLKEELGEPQMAKVMAARSFTVRLRVPAAPRYCQPFLDRQLDLRRTTPSGLSWEASE